MTDDPAAEDTLITAAQQGDQQAYGQLVVAYRPELHAHCYRMLGSPADAEDAVQEALVRAWRGMPGFERRGSLRHWLYTIATNSCLKMIERRPVPLGAEPAWIEPYPGLPDLATDPQATPEARYDQRESVELAFIVAIQLLTPAQRAALVLHDVLAFTAAEIAEMLQTTPTSVYSLLQRAHKALHKRRDQPSQQVTLRRLGDEAVRDLVERYVTAWHDADVDALVALLTTDAVLSMPPLPGRFCGPASIRTFLASSIMAQPGHSRLVATSANGQLAFGHYRLDPAAGRYQAHSLDILTVRAERIAEITAFVQPGMFGRFGLSPYLLAPRSGSQRS